MLAECPAADHVGRRDARQDVVGYPGVGAVGMLFTLILGRVEELDRSRETALDGGGCAGLDSELHRRGRPGRRRDSSPTNWMPSARIDASSGSLPTSDLTSSSENSTTLASFPVQAVTLRESLSTWSRQAGASASTSSGRTMQTSMSLSSVLSRRAVLPKR